MRRMGSIVIAAATCCAVAVVAAPQASAVTQSSLSMSSSFKSFTSSTGKTLKVWLSAYKTTTSGDTTKVSTTINVARGTPYGVGEQHGWSVRESRSSFTYSNGSGSLTSGTQLGTLGSFSLKFTRTGQSSRKCKVSGSMTTVKGRLTGSFHFKTGGSAWGNLGANSVAFPTPNYVYVLNGCNDGEGTTLPLCQTSLTWNGPSTNGATPAGSSITYSGQTQVNQIAVYRTVMLASPAGASRSDLLRAPARPLSVNSVGSLVIGTKSGSGVSGSAKITKGSVTGPSSQTCKTSGGVHKTQKSTQHLGSFSSPSGGHLVFHFAITPDATIGGSGSGYWSKSTFS